jgi:multidrug efflux pump subunit AcrA (membrane-fusion protein)
MQDGGKDSNMNLTAPEFPPVLWPVVSGLLIVLSMIAGIIAWSAIAPLQSAAIAPGSVNLDSYRKTVQHYEGGLVKDILIREGQSVAEGDILILLDETRASANVDVLQAQLASEEKQLSFINEEIVSVEVLLAKGLAQKTRILELYRRKAQLDGDRSQHRAQLRAAKDVIARSVIRAPIAGTVVGLQVHTSGGVVKAGDPLLFIVPSDEPLVIEARVNPNDIDIVHKGQAAQVRLTPFNARLAPLVSATVEWISADALNDQKTSSSFYLARIKFEVSPQELPGNMQLYPGMPAEVMFLTGERTFMEYLAAPVVRSFYRAFREQ